MGSASRATLPSDPTTAVASPDREHLPSRRAQRGAHRSGNRCPAGTSLTTPAAPSSPARRSIARIRKSNLDSFLADNQPLPAGALAYIAEATGTAPARVDEPHTAAPAEDDDDAAIGIPLGSPVLLNRTQYYTTDGKLIKYAETTTAVPY